jgi:protein SCO1
MACWEPKTAPMFRIAFSLLGSFFVFCCSQSASVELSLPYYNEPTFSPIFLKNAGEAEKAITHTIADFSFLNQDSLVIDQRATQGKIHVANFIFTSCGDICPILTKNLKKVSDDFSQDSAVVFLSFSVTPWIDSPSVLNSYKKLNGIDNPHWHFLTGAKSEIYDLARTSYFAEEDIGFSKDSSEFLHTEHVILVDEQRKIRGIYNGTLQLDMEQLKQDLFVLRSTN